MTAINMQTQSKTHSGNAGQYTVFSQTIQEQSANIHYFHNNYCESLNLLFYKKEETFTVKIMTGPVHKVTGRHFEFLLTFKLMMMELDDELHSMGLTTYQGIGSRKNQIPHSDPKCLTFIKLINQPSLLSMVFRNLFALQYGFYYLSRNR